VKIFGRHESYEERITIGSDGKPERHIKKVSRDLTEEEAKAMLSAGPLAAMDEALRRLNEGMRKKS